MPGQIIIDQLGSWATQAFWILFILGLCIFSHELGHFLAAKLSHMRVREFAFGLGPILFGKKWGETLYSVRAVPFGGLNDIAGMEPGEQDVPGGFHTRPRWQRFVTIFAGVFMNVVLAMVLFWVIAVFHGVAITDSRAIVIGKVMPGEPAEVAGFQVGDEIVAVDGSRHSLMIGEVAPSSPAEQAGFQPGYFILTANGHDIAVPRELVETLGKAQTNQVRIGAIDTGARSIADSLVTIQLVRVAVDSEISPDQAIAVAREQLGLTFEPLDQGGVVRYLSLHPNTKIDVSVVRGEREIALTVHPGEVWGRMETITTNGQLDAPHRKLGRIGVLITPPMRKAGVLEGLAMGAMQSVGSVVMVVQSIRGMLIGKIAAEPAGPIGIMAMTAERAQAGWAAVLSLGGLISANLAVINLLPFPPFDGFHIVLIGYEGIIRRRIRARPETIIRLAGIFLIMLLFVWLIAKDVSNLIEYGTP